MRIDQRLRDAAAEVSRKVAAVAVPETGHTRHAARTRRAMAMAVAAFVVVVGAIGITAVLRDEPADRSVVDSAPSPEVTEPALTTVAQPEPAAIEIPAGAIEVPFLDVSADRADEALERLDEMGSRFAEIETLGQVGDEIMFAVATGDGLACLVAVGPSVASVCAPEGERLELGPSLSFTDDPTRLTYRVAGMPPAGTELLLVTVGEQIYAQQPVDGYVAMTVTTEAAQPVTVAARGADGHPLETLSFGEQDEPIRELVLDVADRAANLYADDHTLDDIVALEKRLAQLRSFIAASGLEQEMEDALDVAAEQLVLAREHVLPPREGTRVLPTTAVAPEVGALLERATGLEVSPDGVVWTIANPRFGDSPEPSYVVALDGATGELLAQYEVESPMFHLAAGSRRVWFGRTADGAIATSAIGYVDRETGQVVTEIVDMTIHEILPPDADATSAFVLGGLPPMLMQVGPDSVVPAAAIDASAFGDDYLLAATAWEDALAWEGALLVGGDESQIRVVDIVTGSVATFADVGAPIVDLLPGVAPGGEPAVWAVLWAEGSNGVTLVDADGDVVDTWDLPAITAAWSDGSSALLLTMAGDLWQVSPGTDAVRIGTVPPGSPDTGWDGVVRSGTGLWFLGGVDGLVRWEQGQ